MYRPIGLPDSRGFYEAFEIAGDAELWDQWTTPAQRAYNASTVQCRDCRGWGYCVTRRGRDIFRDNYGCATCGGLGKIPDYLLQRPAMPQPEGIEATLAERGSRYGDFVTHAAIAQQLKAVMAAAPRWHDMRPDQREALDMVMHKVARILNGDPDYADSWRDIIGYARLVEKRLTGAQ